MVELDIIHYLDATGITPLASVDKLELTDWLVIRHYEETTLKLPTSLTEVEFEELCLARQEWRGNVSVGNDFFKQIDKLGYSKIIDKLKEDNPIFVESLTNTKKDKKL